MLGDAEMLRLLGYVQEHGDSFNHPVWLCPPGTWIEAERLGYIEKGATKPFIARYGSYFQAYKLTPLGLQKFFELLPKAQAAA